MAERWLWFISQVTAVEAERDGVQITDPRITGSWPVATAGRRRPSSGKRLPTASLHCIADENMVRNRDDDDADSKERQMVCKAAVSRCELVGRGPSLHLQSEAGVLNPIP